MNPMACGNIKDMVLKMALNNMNPMIGNLINMAKSGDTKGVEKFARNLCKERGVDFDKEIANFMKNFK